MADDEKDATTPGMTPDHASAAPQPVSPAKEDHGPEKGVEGGPHEPAALREGTVPSEWTVSDRRGPLQSAESDVERFVPAHETDAEGGVDASAPTSEIAHDAPASAEPAATTPSDPLPPEPTSPGPTRATAEPVQAERRGSFLPVAAGLVIGAMIGAGSAWLVYSQSAGGDDDAPKIAALSTRVDALDKRPDVQPALDKLRSDFAALQGKVASLGQTKTASTAPAATIPVPPAAQPAQGAAKSAAPKDTPTAPDAALAAKVAALAATVDALKARPAATPAPTASADTGKVAALASGLDEAQKRVADTQKQVAEAHKQAEAAQAALGGVKDEQKALSDKVAALSTAAADAQKQAQGAQSGVDGVIAQQKTLEGKLGSPALAVVADSLVQQIESGRPFGRQVDALAALGADPTKIAVLKENAAQGVPSAQTLLGRWKALVEPVVATGNKAPADANFGERLEHGLFGLVSVHRADGTVGDDLASKVNLVASDLATGDTAGASATWQALPPDAKAKSATWGAQAKIAAEALAAARDLQHQAIDALGAKKS